MKKIYILMIAICMINIANAQQKNNFILNLGMERIKNPLLANFTEGKTLIPNNKFKQKSVNAIIWNFDTIVTYDENNIPLDRIIQSFNNYGNILTSLQEIWQNNVWIKTYKNTYSYDVNWNKISSLYEQWQNNDWVNYYKSTFTNDANGNQLTSLYEQWQNNTWVNSSKTTYTYDANSNQLTSLYEQWQNNTWVNSSKSTYTYDANGNQLTSLQMIWQNNAWVNTSKTTNTYNTNGDWITEFIELWQNNAWVNYYKSTFTNDANGNWLTSLAESWQSNSWVNSFKVTFTNDANGNRLNELYQDWQSNSWVNSYNYTFTYDAYGNSITGKFEIWQNNNWLLSINSYELQVFSAKNIIDNLSQIASYQAHFVSFTTGINETNIKPINIYPNPASNNLTINLSQLKNLQNTSVSIYDIQGKLLLHENIQQPLTKINITQFAKGIYVVKVINDNDNMVSKFIKE